MRWDIRFAILSLLALATGCNRCCDRGEVCEVVEEQYVHKYGVPVHQKDWNARGKVGQVITKQKNGVVVTKSFLKGDLHGDVTYTFPHSDEIEKKETYHYGTLVREVLHYPSGTPMEEIDYVGPESKNVIFWYESGTPQRKEEFEGDLLLSGAYYTLTNKLESRIDNGQGDRVNRNQYGEMISVDAFKGGQMVSRTTFYPNGSPKEIVPFHAGKVEGVKKSFSLGGEPLTVEHWENDRLDGTALIFKNGEKFAEVPYSKGKKHGLEQRFRGGTAVVEQINWREDKRHGPSVSHIGGTKKVDYFLDGKPVTKSQYERLKKPTTISEKSH